MTTTHEAPVGATNHVVTPERIFEIAQGFMASKHLFAASALGVFEALGEGPADLDGLAARTGLTRRTARISADAMVAIGLLDRHGDRYANSPVAAAFLAGTTPADLRPLLRFWDRLSYPAWQDLAGALARGRPAREIFEIDDELVPVMSAGIAAATAAACHA
ncbi:MAG: methyltransferase family protein, partial [Micromonosporaceae bacterium]